MQGHVRKRASVWAFVDRPRAQRCLGPAVLPAGRAIHIMGIGRNAHGTVGRAPS